MALTSRFQGRQTQCHVELLDGILFIAGFGYLVFRVDPRVAAFEGGLVVGYLLRMWEKMSIYERILEETVAEEAEQQVASEVEERVADEAVEQVGTEVDEVLEEQVGEKADDTVDTRVEESVDSELEKQVPANIDELDELADVLHDRDGAPDVDELVIEEDVEDLVDGKVDAALEEEEDGRGEAASR